MISCQKLIIVVSLLVFVGSAHTMELPTRRSPMIPSPSALECSIHSKAQTLLKKYEASIERANSAVILWGSKCGEEKSVAAEHLDRQKSKYLMFCKVYNVFQTERRNGSTVEVALDEVDVFLYRWCMPVGLFNDVHKVFVQEEFIPVSASK